MACKRKRPLMHVDKVTSAHRVGNFIEDKYKVICEKIKKDDARFVIYNASYFSDMLVYFLKDNNVTGLHIYFASYSKTGKDVPKGYEELMTLIFAPTKAAAKENEVEDRGDYYIIFPGKAHTEIKKELASEWVKNYQQIKLPALNHTVPDGDDTKLIYYRRGLIEDLVDEIDCQKATGIKAYFCKMEDAHRYKHQLMLDFVLTNKVGADEVDFNVQDRDGWEDREKVPEESMKQVALKKKERFFDLDTGSPCPPNTCRGSLP